MKKGTCLAPPVFFPHKLHFSPCIVSVCISLDGSRPYAECLYALRLSAPFRYIHFIIPLLNYLNLMCFTDVNDQRVQGADGLGAGGSCTGYRSNIMANSSSCFQVHGAGFTRTMAHTMLQKNYFLKWLFKSFGSSLQFHSLWLTL